MPAPRFSGARCACDCKSAHGEYEGRSPWPFKVISLILLSIVIFGATKVKVAVCKLVYCTPSIKTSGWIVHAAKSGTGCWSAMNRAGVLWPWMDEVPGNAVALRLAHAGWSHLFARSTLGRMPLPWPLRAAR